ncbi:MULTISPECIES: hypothetical protein [unclassified Wolbachia]|uniref:hypothetical protein n=1 Tax=unclassified Wolbachia TaxID=2640676 RepID=UPI0012E87D80|nr:MULTISPECIES: hypothetical protein [unclassified Wolbachia]
MQIIVKTTRLLFAVVPARDAQQHCDLRAISTKMVSSQRSDTGIQDFTKLVSIKALCENNVLDEIV